MQNLLRRFFRFSSSTDTRNGEQTLKSVVKKKSVDRGSNKVAPEYKHWHLWALWFAMMYVWITEEMWKGMTCIWH